MTNQLRRSTLTIAAWLCLASTAMAQQVPPQNEPAQPRPLTDDQQAQLDELFETIDQERADAARTLAMLSSADDALAAILDIRLVSDRIALLQSGMQLADRVLALREDNYIVDQRATAAVDVLLTHPDIVDAATAHIDSLLVVPTVDMGAAEQAATEQRFFALIDFNDQTVGLMARTLAALEELGTELPEADADFEQRLLDLAENASVYLQLAQSELAGIRAGLRALPNDAELSGKLTVVESRITRTASVLQRRLTFLENRDIDASDYRQQLVLVTGELTPDAFRARVLGGIIASWRDRALEFVSVEGPHFLWRALLFCLIIYVFYKLARISRRIVAHTLDRSTAKPSQLLSDMVLGTVGNVVLFLGALIALSQIGISLGPVLAGLGIAGFVIGFALQDSLSNFASGMMILFTRPYDVGDTVELGGMLGKVHKMSLVNTTIHTYDNQLIVMPNTMIWGGIIRNITAQSLRRVDMMFGVSYSDDIEKTEQVIHEVLRKHELVLDEPEPIVRVHELADSSVNFAVRPWVRTEDYWTVYWDITRAIKIHFDEAGISIPFPQRDVHIKTDGMAGGELQPAQIGPRSK